MKSAGNSRSTPTDPLHAILEMLDSGGIYSPTDIALRLEISTELARAMTSQLAQAGYLATLCLEPQNACQSCGRKSGCVTGSGGRGAETLMLTEKGKQAIARRRSA